jgi:hypothetical protein
VLWKQGESLDCLLLRVHTENVAPSQRVAERNTVLMCISVYTEDVHMGSVDACISCGMSGAADKRHAAQHLPGALCATHG